MRYDAPWGIVKGHHHLATPELDRWKAAQQGHAAVSPTLTHTQNGFVNQKQPHLSLEKDNIYSRQIKGCAVLLESKMHVLVCSDTHQKSGQLFLSRL